MCAVGRLVLGRRTWLTGGVICVRRWQVGARETDVADRRVATHADVFDSMKQQLLILVEWAKCIPAFLQLCLEDQVSTVKS